MSDLARDRGRHGRRARERLARLPLRVRLVAGFSATMLLVLTAAGAFVYWRVEVALDRQLDDDLARGTKILAPLVQPGGRVAADGDGLVGAELYQVLDREGRVLSSSASLARRSLVSRRTVDRALEAPVTTDIVRDVGALLPTSEDPLRVQATRLPDASGQRAAVLVVAVLRDHRDEALLELLAQLAAAGLGALLVTAFVGDRLARFALLPVERYRAQADDIAAGASGVRLEVPVARHDEVTRLGHTLNTMLDRLEEAVERERHFVNDASHELRTPLTLLSTRVQLARRRSRSVAEHEAVLTEIQTDVVRLVALAEHLLRVGHDPDDGAVGPDGPDGPHGPPRASAVCDLAEVAQIEVERRRAHDPAPAAGASSAPAAPEPVLRAGPDAVPVAVAAASVGQVVGNLLDNAARHGAAPVQVRIDRSGAWGRLVVSDAGQGMDAELLATATRRFTRSADSRSREGFGLGLSLVEGIVTRAGGELRLCSRGRHERHGPAAGAAAVVCDHQAEGLSVTVLLPRG